VIQIGISAIRCGAAGADDVSHLRRSDNSGKLCTQGFRPGLGVFRAYGAGLVAQASCEWPIGVGSVWRTRSVPFSRLPKGTDLD